MFKKFKTSVLSLFLAFSLAVAPVTPAAAAELPQTDVSIPDVSVSDSQFKAFSTTASDSLKEASQKRADAITQIYGVTSVQYALIRDGEIIMSGTSGYNNVAKKKAPSNTNMYGIASISKIFTTVAVLQLADQGKINLDKPIVDYIPDFKMADERYKDITPRMLLNHSSGLMGSTMDSSLLLGDEGTNVHDSFLETLKSQRLKAAPGEFSVYCNDGFTLAEILVEKVSGTTFTDYIAKNITSPLGMSNTKTPSDSFKRTKLAGIYDTKGTKLPYESFCTYGAGGLYSTATDLCKFSTIFTKDTNLLSSSMVDATKQDEYKRGEWYPDDDSMLSYGLGWDSVNTYPFTQYNIKALVKGGDSYYYHSGLVVLPDQNMAAAVVCSGGSSGLAELFANAMLLDTLKDDGTISEIKPNKTFTAPTKTAIPDDIMAYQGFYGNYSVPMKVTMEKAGTMTISSTDEDETSTQSYTYGGNNKFYTYDGSTFISFIKNDGKTYMYQSGYTNVPLIGQLAMSYYQGQKLEANPVSDSVLAAWKEYLDRDFYVVSEKYSSAQYISSLGKSHIEFADGLDNYIFSAQIKDETTAQAVVEIPGMWGRDLRDYKLVKKDGTKYITSDNTVLICGESVKNLSTKKSFKVTVPSTGYAQYFKISNKAANKKITVTLPKNSSFTVYDKDGNVTFSSYLTGKNKAKLPKKGTIVFVGSKKANFKVKYVS